MNRFEATASALSYSIIRERCRDADLAGDFPENRVVNFVLEQHGRMSTFLGWPLAALTLGFDAWGVLRSGRPFHQQDHATRWRQIEAWRSSSIGPCRDLVRFFESLAVFGCYSMSPGVAARPTTRVGVANSRAVAAD